jgi:predicted dehydrogenase
MIQPLRIGILGAARIAPDALIAPARLAPGVRVQAVAARDAARAQAFASAHDVPHIAPDYAALLRRDDIDAVYVALPVSHHAQWTIAALEAGKAVLCEKPMALDSAEARTMIDAAHRTGQLLMIATHCHYHPYWTAVEDIIRSGVLGRIMRLGAAFRVKVSVGDHQIRLRPELGGGALWDIGWYPAHWLRWAMRAEPEVITATARKGDTGVDLATSAVLHFPGGIEAALDCAMDTGREAWLTLEGTGGTLEAINPLGPQLGHALKLTVEGHTDVRQVSLDSTYLHQLRAFETAWRTGAAPATDGADGLATLQLLEAIQRAARV